MNPNELYEIRVRERLDPGWVERQTGMSVLYAQTGGTLLAGFLPNQAALYRILMKLRDRQLSLVSVNHLGIEHVLEKQPLQRSSQ